MREISLDTETTGLDSDTGDRIVELGCVELWNHIPTGRTFHEYFNPLRQMSEGAAKITGLTDQYLRDKPLFKEKSAEFVDFIGSDPLIIHNAGFDIKFLNSELDRVGGPMIDRDRVVDTLTMARRRFPGAQVSLDALCRRFAIDLSGREKHGALLDAELLAQVYLELRGGRQPSLTLARDQTQNGAADVSRPVAWTRTRRSRLTEDEDAAHRRFVETLGADAAWRALLKASGGSTQS